MAGCFHLPTYLVDPYQMVDQVSQPHFVCLGPMTGVLNVVEVAGLFDPRLWAIGQLLNLFGNCLLFLWNTLCCVIQVCLDEFSLTLYYPTLLRCWPFNQDDQLFLNLLFECYPWVQVQLFSCSVCLQSVVQCLSLPWKTKNILCCYHVDPCLMLESMYDGVGVIGVHCDPCWTRLRHFCSTIENQFDWICKDCPTFSVADFSCLLFGVFCYLLVFFCGLFCVPFCCSFCGIGTGVTDFLLTLSDTSVDLWRTLCQATLCCNCYIWLRKGFCTFLVCLHRMTMFIWCRYALLRPLLAVFGYWCCSLMPVVACIESYATFNFGCAVLLPLSLAEKQDFLKIGEVDPFNYFFC